MASTKIIEFRAEFPFLHIPLQGLSNWKYLKTRCSFKSVLILFLLALVVFSCQSEVVEETLQDQEDVLMPNSELLNKMRSIVLNDGTRDDVLDNASCFSIALPVTIMFNASTIIIESSEDVMGLEVLFSEFEDDIDVEFVFPITIILNNYEDIVIENQQQLDVAIDDCLDNQDEIIDCIDFSYPISFLVYNSNFQVEDNVDVYSDEELYIFLENINENYDSGVLVVIDFSLSLVYTNGAVVEVVNNEALETEIYAAQNFCDDSETNCLNEEAIVEHLLECYWMTSSASVNEGFVFNFQDDQNVLVEGEGLYGVGIWMTYGNGDNEPTTVEISQFEGNLQIFNGTWTVVECSDTQMIFTLENGSEMILERECE
ncbi:MAG: hypothetical protein HRT67_07610 [Flavobacteriaceae bacterium]|nr:hypothetical protein [Flavobacteriaceae bacterium]